MAIPRAETGRSGSGLRTGRKLGTQGLASPDGRRCLIPPDALTMLESRSLHEPRLPPDRSMTQYPPAAPDAAVHAEVLAGIEAIQLEGFRDGPRFGVWWRPAQRAPRGAVLCVQPLGRERSLARHVLASQAWRLAGRGWAVLMPDLYGCGDSPGEPGEASLEGWRADLLRA